MVTLKTLKAYANLHETVEDFLRKKVTEYKNAERGLSPYDNYGKPAPEFRGIEFRDRMGWVKGAWTKEGNDIRISFGWECDIELDGYTLPLENLSWGVRRHSGKTSPFRAGMRAEPRTLVNYSFSNP